MPQRTELPLLAEYGSSLTQQRASGIGLQADSNRESGFPTAPLAPGLIHLAGGAAVDNLGSASCAFASSSIDF